jgi:hypothetical protein
VAAYCPLCTRGEVHDCQLVDRPIRVGFHSITMYTNAAGVLVTDVDMFPLAVSL